MKGLKEDSMGNLKKPEATSGAAAGLNTDPGAEPEETENMKAAQDAEDAEDEQYTEDAKDAEDAKNAEDEQYAEDAKDTVDAKDAEDAMGTVDTKNAKEVKMVTDRVGEKVNLFSCAACLEHPDCFASIEGRCTALSYRAVDGYDNTDCVFYKSCEQAEAEARKTYQHLKEIGRYDLIADHIRQMSALGALDEEIDSAEQYGRGFEEFRESDYQNQLQKAIADGSDDIFDNINDLDDTDYLDDDDDLDDTDDLDDAGDEDGADEEDEDESDDESGDVPWGDVRS